jgi:hypothetical protein
MTKTAKIMNWMETRHHNLEVYRQKQTLHKQNKNKNNTKRQKQRKVKQKILNKTHKAKQKEKKTTHNRIKQIKN